MINWWKQFHQYFFFFSLFLPFTYLIIFLILSSLGQRLSAFGISHPFAKNDLSDWILINIYAMRVEPDDTKKKKNIYKNKRRRR